MKHNDLFTLIRNTKYDVTGLDVNYKIIYVAEEHTVYLLFQGTSSKTDVKIDLDFPVKVYKRQYSCIKAHGGFVKAWKSANDVIIRELTDMCNLYNAKAVIAGHSLGGDMTILAAEDYFFRTGRKADVITFGCPNVLFGKESKEYVKSCCNNIYQYAQYNDMIPTIPIGYTQLNKIKCGRKFNLFEFTFHTKKYHCGYGDLEY